VEDLDSGPGVGQRAVHRFGGAAEVIGEGPQAAVADLLADQAAGQGCGADHRAGQPGVIQAREVGVEEAEVEAGVVGHQHRAAAELQKGRQHGLHRWAQGHEVVGDAGQPGDGRGDGDAGVHQRGELGQHLAAVHLDRAELGYPVRGRGAPGGLEVHDHEGHRRQGDGEVGQRGHGPRA